MNVPVGITPSYRTALYYIQTFVRWIAERGNWLSVRVPEFHEKVVAIPLKPSLVEALTKTVVLQ